MDFSSAVDGIQEFGPQLVYLGIYVMLVLSALGMPLPEDLTLIATGYLITKGLAHPVPAAATAILGVLTGDQIGYSLGRHFGPRIVRHRLFSRVLTEKRYARIRGRFERYGEKMVFFARFVPGLRGPVFIASGILGMPRGRFLLYDSAGALLSVPLFIRIGRLAGPRLEAVLLHLARGRSTVAVLLLLAAACLAVRAIVRRRRGTAAGERGRE